MRAGGENRGNSEDRRRRKQWLLDTFGDGTTAPCFDCQIPLTRATLTVDRITPGAAGGRYVRGNIRPSCQSCNVSAWQPWMRFLSQEVDSTPEVSDVALTNAALAASFEEAFAIWAEDALLAVGAAR